MWGLIEAEVEEEEEEEEEGRAEGVLLPEEDREDEVSTGEEAVREGVMKRERALRKIANLNRGMTCKTGKVETKE